MATRRVSSLHLVDRLAHQGIGFYICNNVRGKTAEIPATRRGWRYPWATVTCRGISQSPGDAVFSVHLKDICANRDNVYNVRHSLATRRRIVVSATRDSSSQRQPTLSNAEKKSLRQKAQRMHENLVTVNAGDKGLTVHFLSGLHDALKANQLVKVRMGCSRQEKKDKTEELERLLDCVCVHSIGSVVILYRQKGLSKPLELESLQKNDEGSARGVADGVVPKGNDITHSQKRSIPEEFKVIE